MNAIAAPSQQAPTTSSAPRATKAQTVAKSLQHIRENLLAPFNEWDILRHSVPSVDSRGERVIALVFSAEIVRQPNSEADRRAQIDRAEWLLVRQPDPADVGQALRKVEAAAAASFDLRQTRFILGLMIDAFPNARPHNPDGYLETVVDIVRSADPSPAIVAKACDEIKRTFKFPPSAAEVLEKIIEAEKSLASFIRIARSFLEKAEFVQMQIEWLGQVPLFDEAAGGTRIAPPTAPLSQAAPIDLKRVGWV